MATVTITNSEGGKKENPGSSITADFGGASIPDGSTINGITINLLLAGVVSSVGDIIVNVIDTQNGGSVSTVNKTASTFPYSLFPTFTVETFGSSSELFGITTFTPSSVAGGGIRVVITNNTSNTLFYEGDGNNSNIVVTFSDPEGGNIKLTTGNIKLTTGKITL